MIRKWEMTADLPEMDQSRERWLLCLLWLSINLAQPSHVCIARCANEGQNQMWSWLGASINGACCSRDQVLTNPSLLPRGHARELDCCFPDPDHWICAKDQFTPTQQCKQKWKNPLWLGAAEPSVQILPVPWWVPHRGCTRWILAPEKQYPQWIWPAMKKTPFFFLWSHWDFSGRVIQKYFPDLLSSFYSSSSSSSSSLSSSSSMEALVMNGVYGYQYKLHI